MRLCVTVILGRDISQMATILFCLPWQNIHGQSTPDKMIHPLNYDRKHLLHHNSWDNLFCELSESVFCFHVPHQRNVHLEAADSVVTPESSMSHGDIGGQVLKSVKSICENENLPVLWEGFMTGWWEKSNMLRRCGFVWFTARKVQEFWTLILSFSSPL